jgi:hypothetical protein
MKAFKSKSFLAWLGCFGLVAGLAMGLNTSAFGATTNTAPSKPLILIGASGTASNIAIKESGIGSLSAEFPYNALTLQCPGGVSFDLPPLTMNGLSITHGAAWDGKCVKISLGATPASVDNVGAAWTSASRTLELQFINGDTESDIQAAIDAALGPYFLQVTGDATAGTASAGSAGVIGGPKVEETGVGVSELDGYATVSDTDGEGSYDNAVWTIDTASSSAADTISISNIVLKLATTVAAGSVSLTVTSEAPFNPGLTSGDVDVAKAVANDALVKLDGVTKDVGIGGLPVALNNVKIVESTGASLSSGVQNNTLTMQLPVGVDFTCTHATVTEQTSEFTVGTGWDGDPVKIAISVSAGGIDATFAEQVLTIDYPTGAAVADMQNAIDGAIGIKNYITVANNATGNSTTIGETLLSRGPAAEETGVGFDNFDDGTLAYATLMDNNSDGQFDMAVWKIDNESTVADTVNISSISVQAAAGVTVGDISATLTSGIALDAQLTIATAAEKGVQATVVDKATAVFSLKSTANKTLPQILAGRYGIELDGIMVVENFGCDIIDNDSLTLTLPAGIYFAQEPYCDSANVASATPPDPTGYNFFIIDFQPEVNDAKGGVLIGKHDTGGEGLKVNVGANVTTGDIVATLTGTIAGKAITPIDVTIGQVVDTIVTVAPNATIPVAGIGATVVFGSFTIKEVAAQALSGNASSITLTLPAGATWSGNPSATITAGAISVSPTATLSSGNSVASFKINAASTSAAKIRISGSVTLASTMVPGDIIATVAGTAGAAGTVTLVKAEDGVSASASGVVTLLPGVPTQGVSDLTFTELFAKGLGADGQFRLILPAGTWASATPVVSVSPADAISTTAGSAFDGTIDAAGDDWDFEIETTYNACDTLIVRTPDSPSILASVITINGLKINVPAGAPMGDVTVNLVDGDKAGVNGVGVKSDSLSMGYIGTPPGLTVSSAVAIVAVGKTTGFKVDGGVEDYTAATSDPAVATATISDTTLTITGVAAGTATITVSDNAEVPDTATIDVTVVTATAIGATSGVVTVNKDPEEYLGLSLNVTNTAGATPAQEWLVFGGMVDDQDIGTFIYGMDANGVGAIAEFDTALDPGAMTYAFDPAANAVDVITLALDGLGFKSGDMFWYGYVYSNAAITSFDTAVFGTDYVLENYVKITLK